MRSVGKVLNLASCLPHFRQNFYQKNAKDNGGPKLIYT